MASPEPVAFSTEHLDHGRRRWTRLARRFALQPSDHRFGSRTRLDMTRQDVADADGLLIATPEYNHSIPGVLKNAIDWLSRPPERVLRRKPVTILGATEGASGARLAQSALREILYSTGSLILPSPVLCLGKAADAFDDAGRLVDPRVRQTLGQLLDAFAAWIERGREVTAGVSS